MTDHRALGASSEVYEYLLSRSTPPDPVYTAIRDDTIANTGDAAGMRIGPDQFTLMRLLTELTGVDLAVEVGTFTGSSGAAIARGLRPGGRLVCCDVSDQWTRIARRHWADAGLADRIDLRIGPALDTLSALWDELAELGGRQVDLAFVDADKTAYLDYYESIVPHLRPGGVLLADNVLWSGRVADPDVTDADTEAIRRFNDHVADDARVDAVILSIGDGITLCRRR